jgi:dihydroorotase
MSNDKILIKGGRIIDPANKTDRIGDLLLAGGKVAQIDKNISNIDGEIIEADGMIVSPGLIDIHVHLREPGDEEAETIATGSAAAVAGGFTSIACMPNTNPALDDDAAIDFIYQKASRSAMCNIYPIGALTKGREGKELAEIGQMVRSGAVAFSDDGKGIADTALMFRALQYLLMFDKTIMQHCEDPHIAGNGVMNSGATATRLGLPGINHMAEELMIQRDLTLVKEMGARYHVCHISTVRSVELVREAKAAGLPVTAEVCPHHLVLTEEACAK